MNITEIIEEMRKLHSELLMVGTSSSYAAFADQLEALTKEPVASNREPCCNKLTKVGRVHPWSCTCFTCAPPPGLEAEHCPDDAEIKRVACDESQQDWDDLRFARIYESAFIDGAKWMRGAKLFAAPPSPEFEAAAMRAIVQQLVDALDMNGLTLNHHVGPGLREALLAAHSALSTDAGREYAERLRKAEEELVHAAQQNAYHHSHLKQLRSELEQCKERLRKVEEERDEAIAQKDSYRHWWNTTSGQLNQLLAELEQCKKDARESFMNTLSESFEQEINRVSELEYNSNEICRHFFKKLRARVADATQERTA